VNKISAADTVHITRIYLYCNYIFKHASKHREVHVGAFLATDIVPNYLYIFRRKEISIFLISILINSSVNKSLQ